MLKPTWETLAPVLRGADVDEEAAWSVVLAHARFVHGAVRRVVLRADDVVATYDGSRDAALEEAFQWVVERLVRRAASGDGLTVTPRPDGSLGVAPKWFFTVCANLARDWVKSQRRRMRREAELAGHAPPVQEAPVSWDDAALRKLQRLIDRPDKAGVPETHVLAYICIYRPEALQRSMVERAQAYVPSAGSRSGRPGLLRSTDETWRLLDEWRRRHGHDTFTAAARAELAWIMRSDDPGPPETWRQRDRKAARTATVTVGKWAIRCADVLTLPRK